MCGCTASVEREGKWYCKRHDPEGIKARREVRRAKWEQEREESIKAQRLKAAAPDMLAALNLIREYGDIYAYRAGHENPYDVICAAIAKAEGTDDA